MHAPTYTSSPRKYIETLLKCRLHSHICHSIRFPLFLHEISEEEDSMTDLAYRQLLRRYISQRESIQTWSDYFLLQEGRRPQVRKTEGPSGESSSGQVFRPLGKGI